MKIIFLGTSAQIPTAKRNHSAIWLNYNEENILIDCGEGTQRQIRKAKLNPCKINRILLTHLHGDHVLGLPGLLSTLALSGYNKKLFIYGPRGTKKFMNDLFKTFNFLREYKIEVTEVRGKFFEGNDFYLESQSMIHGTSCNAYCFVKKDQLRIDKKKLEKSKLPAGPLLQKIKQGKNVSYKGKKYLAKNLTYLEKGKKISFVMDTLMNDKIIPFVKKSNVLICESTFSSDSENGDELAKEHKHLTAKQAGEIAKKSGSEKLILTHLSQRYDSKQNVVLDEAKKIFNNVIIARDLDEFEL